MNFNLYPLASWRCEGFVQTRQEFTRALKKDDVIGCFPWQQDMYVVPPRILTLPDSWWVLPRISRNGFLVVNQLQALIDRGWTQQGYFCFLSVFFFFLSFLLQNPEDKRKFLRLQVISLNSSLWNLHRDVGGFVISNFFFIYNYFIFKTSLSYSNLPHMLIHHTPLSAVEIPLSSENMLNRV